jgi:hypothetical protein
MPLDRLDATGEVPTRGRLVASLGLCVVGLAMTAALLGRFFDARCKLRLLPGSIEQQKFGHFQAHADDYDLVYVGTSRVLRGFDSAAFAERLAELGRPIRAYNFGLVGLGLLEERFLLDWIRELEPARLVSVLVDPTDRDVIWHIPRSRAGRRGIQSAAGLPTNLFTLRDVHWHTPSSTWNAVVSLASTDEGWEWIQLSGLHVMHGLERALNIGLAKNVVIEALEGPLAVDELDGFVGKDGAPARGEEREERALQEDARTPTILQWQAFQAACERLRTSGVQVLFIVPPLDARIGEIKAAERAGFLPGVRYFSETLPEALEAQDTYFYDRGHLNRKGARLFSRRLAEELAPVLAPRRP